ncbi:MAG: hypothetical protein G3M70_13970 [Candidatus Nitronauta litoralis]|uniref:Teneurin-like YD-shell domain-containing protein n=1 Tax=Candidatus Nitronauta litoralis TaxID=2705533 RepID=A0A7T0BZK4_9BACT|nr:MAG: hypothetical protein G3M70_13970 [Candidatus Nitronauta litoralis]
MPISTTWSRGSFIVGTVSREYDNSFRITSRTVSDNATSTEVARFAYDDDDLLTSTKYDPDGIAGNGDEFELGLIYDTVSEIANSTANGLLETTEMYDNASPPVKKITDDYLYNGFGEMEEYSASYLASERFKTVFERDKLGRITKKTETLNGSTNSTQYEYEYTYEVSPGVIKDAGRLQKVITTPVINDVPDTGNSTSVTYNYDANSNRLSNGAVYDNQDRLTSTSSATYTYTDNGELLTKTVGSDVTTYTYDVLGNLRNVDLPNTTDDIEYLIDGRNRRIGKKVGGTLERQWLYKDQLNPIAELDGSGNITKRFIYASRANVPDVMVIPTGLTNAGVYRIISDHLGSPRFVIDTSSGNTVQALDYDEWGNLLSDTNPGFQPFGFAGGLYDEDTKLIRFGARDYDPETGRWTSKDPIRFIGRSANFMSYAQNDPVNFRDLSGLFGNKRVPINHRYTDVHKRDFFVIEPDVGNDPIDDWIEDNIKVVGTHDIGVLNLETDEDGNVTKNINVIPTGRISSGATIKVFRPNPGEKVVFSCSLSTPGAGIFGIGFDRTQNPNTGETSFGSINIFLGGSFAFSPYNETIPLP